MKKKNAVCSGGNIIDDQFDVYGLRQHRRQLHYRMTQMKAFRMRKMRICRMIRTMAWAVI